MGHPIETQSTRRGRETKSERETERERHTEIERSLDKSLEQWASVIIETLLSCGATGHKPVAWKICALPSTEKKEKKI